MLGARLTEELVGLGHDVRALDTKPMPDASESVETVRGDVRNSDIAQLACEGVDIVFHLAAVSPRAQTSEEKFRSTNVKGTETMLSAAVAESVRRFVFSSSTEIYGVPDRAPCTEDAPKKLPGAYSRTKLEGEELCLRYAADFGIEVVMLRTPPIFGPGRQSGKFHSGSFEDIAAGRPIRIIGDGENRRQVVACSDACAAFILAAESSAAVGEAFNIASESAKALSVAQTTERVIGKVGSKSTIKFTNKTLARVMIKLMSALGRPLPFGEHSDAPLADYVFEIEKAKKLLDYKPRKDDVEALAETAQWYCMTNGLTIDD